ncbi:MAG: DUF4097 family beta strand repeat protein, partial [Acidobacteria bacterium]|nr:DUF4097 family beta strand repeat protein [Acidobacteriota bacterium]
GNKSPYGERSGGAFNLEIKEQTVSAAPKKLSIDAGVNGGIRVKGWERNEIYIKACVQAFGKDETEARARTAAVRIESEGGIVRAVASSAAVSDGNYSFGVSYDIRVPVNTDLSLKTNNGGINLAGVNGSIEFDLHNGGVILDRIAGSVRGQTVNGNLTFNLSGERWEGDSIDARTTNGSIFINVPENYSARLETGTRRGNFYVNLPVEKKRENNYEFNLDLGAGGAIIRATTTNGQVTIKSKTVAAKENKL